MSSLKEIQNKSLEMAEYFVEFCKEHNLLCYLCGGGAIGGLRNKGFIPWDDDLDFFMPRKDYEKLPELWRKYAKEQYFLSKSDSNFVDRNLFITIRDKETTCIKPYQQDLDMPHGLALDVIPLDYYPKNEADRKKQVRWALIYSLFCAQTIPEKHGAIMKWGSTILLGLTPGKLRYKIWKKAEKEMTKYTLEESDGITELCTGPGYMKKKYPIEAFEDNIFIDFENTKMPIPVGYDIYLKTAFGDYMTPPPKEKQVPHHDSVIADMENSYLKYKGEYYGRKISVIVPVYNVEQYLERCVDSIINQTYKNLEIILVNDGSTDNSGQLCDELAKKDDRIRVIHKKNGGLSDARNAGINEAKSDLIGFIDSDDYIDEDMYEVLMNNIKDANADLSMCGHYDVYNNVPEAQVTDKKIWELSSKDAIKMVMEAKILSVTAVNKLYKKSLFSDLKFEIGKIAEDAFIMIKLLDKCNVVVATNEKKYYYVHRENSITTQKFSTKFLNVIEAYEQNRKIILEKYPELQDVAQMRMNWAYFYVLDRLLLDKEYNDKKLENKLISYLKNHSRDILKDSLFTKGRKIGFIALLLNRNLYRKIIEKRGY